MTHLFGAGLTWLLAAGGGGEFAPVAEGVRQVLVDAAVAGDRLGDFLAGIAMGIPPGFGGGALLPGRLLVFREAGRRRRKRKREIMPVTGADPEGPRARFAKLEAPGLGRRV